MEELFVVPLSLAAPLISRILVTRALQARYGILRCNCVWKYMAAGFWGGRGERHATLASAFRCIGQLQRQAIFLLFLRLYEPP